MERDPVIDQAWDRLQSGDVQAGRAALKSIMEDTEQRLFAPRNITAAALLAFDALRPPLNSGLMVRTRDALKLNARNSAEAASLEILQWETMPSNDMRAIDLQRLESCEQPLDAHGAYLLALADLMAFDQIVLTTFSAEYSSGVASDLSVATACLLHGNQAEALEWFDRALEKPDRTAARYGSVIRGLSRNDRSDIAERSRIAALLGRAVALRDLARYTDARKQIEDYEMTIGSNPVFGVWLGADCYDRAQQGATSTTRPRDPEWKDTQAIGYQLRRRADMDGVLSRKKSLLGKLFG